MKTTSLFTLLAAALHNLPHVHAFSLVPSAIHRAQLSKSKVPFSHHATKGSITKEPITKESDGLQSQFVVELDYPIEKFWKVVSDWDDISWVKGAEKVEQLGDNVRRLSFSSGSQLDEKLLSVDEVTKTLVYKVLTGPMPVKMYEGTVKLTSKGPNKTVMNYDTVYIPNDEMEPVQFKAAIDTTFTARGEWMKEKFRHATKEPITKESIVPEGKASAIATGTIDAPIDKVW